jgi:hypothetical protein
MPLSDNPFAALSLIVAPAILTNASTLLILSTSNRLARAVDRARALTQELEERNDFASEIGHQLLRELTSAEERSVLLVRALRIFYMAVSGFASAALLSLVGALLAPKFPAAFSSGLELLVIAAAVVAVGSLVMGAVLLVRETRMVVRVLSERAESLRFRAGQGRKRE